MKRYNVTMKIFANIAVQATSPEAARSAIDKMLRDVATVKMGPAELVVEGGEVTGVYSADWDELELMPPDRVVAQI